MPIRITSRRKAMAFALALGICLIVAAVTLNISWIILNWRELWIVTIGVIFFGLIIAGVILNTTFLLREIRRNEQHDSFINAVTHELKTPITSIRLYLQTLQTRAVEESQRRQFYGIMLEDSERLMRTVEHVLKAGQVAQKKEERNLQPVELGVLAQECMELARIRHHLAPESLRWGLEPRQGESYLVMGDLEDLRTAVANILDNAVKYSSTPVEITVDISPSTLDRLDIRISDKGIGIPRGELKRIFRRFYRASPLPKVRGTGLGLFIVRSIARRHGGRVYAESEGAGKGTVVTLELPRVHEV